MQFACIRFFYNSACKEKLKLKECFCAGLIAPQLVVGPPPPGYSAPPPQVVRVPVDRKFLPFYLFLCAAVKA